MYPNCYESKFTLSQEPSTR